MDKTEKYASKGGIRGWILFDWAVQPFHTLIITFVFAPYFASTVVTNESVDFYLESIGLGFWFDSFGAEKGAGGQALWGLIAGFAGLIIAFSAPVFGAIADASGPRKPWIFAFGVVAVVGSSTLWFAEPGAGNIHLIVIAVMLTIIGFEFATVFNNAMMPDLVPRSELGRLSGTAWGFGYIGGLVALIIVLALLAGQASTGKTIIGLDPLFGLSVEQREGDRITGPLTALWFVVFAIPLFLFTPDATRVVAVKGSVSDGLSRLFQTLKELPQQASYLNFLISSMLYRDGLNALYVFGGIYAVGVLGWDIIQVGIFGLLANITGAVGAMFGGRMDKKFGPKPVVFWTVALLIIACITVISTTRESVLFVIATDSNDTLPDIVFYVAGGMIGAAGGAIQAASRTLLVDQVDRTKITEAFGLYALSGKATAFVGPLSISWATAYFGSKQLGVTPVVVLLVMGLVFLMFVKAERVEP